MNLNYLQKNKSHPAVQIISWALVAACMAVIFWFSAQVAEASNEQSGGILAWLEPILGSWLTEHIVRKFAHALEFCGLAFLMFNGLYQSTGMAKPFSAWGLTVLYAATDEFHQLYVPGRSGQFKDVCVDGAGAAAGVLAGLFIVFIYILIRNSINKKESK